MLNNKRYKRVPRTVVPATRRVRTIPARTLLLSTATLVLASASPAQQPGTVPVATARLEVNSVRQPIYGFGGSQTYNGDFLADFAGRDAVFKALFEELRLDIFRLRNWHDYDGQQARFDTVTKTFAQGALKYGKSEQRGGKAPVRLMFTAWSPPARLKSNNLVSGRSDGTEKGLENATLKSGSDGKYVYGEYADWWLSSVKQFKALTGVYPNYISLQNELDLSVSYEGCRFLPTEGKDAKGYALAGYDQALASVSDKLKSTLGKDAPRIVGPEPFTIRMDKDTNRVASYLTADTPLGKASLDRLFGVSFHIYGSGVDKEDPTEFHTALKSVRETYRNGNISKPLFQTEFLEGDTFLSLARQIHDTLTEGEASSYFIWMSARSVHIPGLAMVYYNPEDGTVEKRERFYAMKHFSAFVGEGWNRIDANCDDKAVKLSAYTGPNAKELVVVLINPTDKEHKVVLQPSGNTFTGAENVAFRSSQGEDGERWRSLGPLPIGNVVTLTKKSMVTVKFTRP